MARVLLVEDDADLGHAIKVNLEDANHECELATTGTAGLGRAVSSSYDVVLLDICLPELDGLNLCKRLREINPTVGIIFLTSRKTNLDKLEGFRAGADDYISKPFSFEELLARVDALARRLNPDPASSSAGELKRSSCLQRGPLEIDEQSRTVRVMGQAIVLTAKEFELLTFLARRPGRVFSRDELLTHVWDYEFLGYENTVNVHVTRVRSKLRVSEGLPEFIETVWGVGYRFCTEEVFNAKSENVSAG